MSLRRCAVEECVAYEADSSSDGQRWRCATTTSSSTSSLRSQGCCPPARTVSYSASFLSGWIVYFCFWATATQCCIRPIRLVCVDGRFDSQFFCSVSSVCHCPRYITSAPRLRRLRRSVSLRETRERCDESLLTQARQSSDIVTSSDCSRLVSPRARR